MDQNLFWPKNFLDLNLSWTKIFFGPNFFWIKKFFWTKIVLDQNLFWTKIYFNQKKVLDQNLSSTKKFFWNKFFFQDQKFPQRIGLSLVGYGSGGGEQQSCCDSNLRAKYQTCALTPSCRFRWGVLVVVVVTGVKQSQLLDFKSWSRSGVWQKWKYIQT